MTTEFVTEPPVCTHAGKVEDPEFDLNEMADAIAAGEGFAITATCTCGSLREYNPQTKLLERCETIATPVRLLFEVECSTCGPLSVVVPESAPELAKEHTRSTGHVVILRGTSDLSNTEPQAWEEASSTFM